MINALRIKVAIIVLVSKLKRNAMNTSITRLAASARIFLAAMTMTLFLCSCGYESGGGTSGGGSGGNGCQSGYCNSNGYCCQQGLVGCDGACYSSTSAAYSATGNSSCLSATTVC